MSYIKFTKLLTNLWITRVERRDVNNIVNNPRFRVSKSIQIVDHLTRVDN